MKDLFQVLDSTENGAALAANQIGLDHRIFAISKKIAQESNIPRLIINPTVIDLGTDMVESREGCLSFPGLSIKKKRPISAEIFYWSVGADMSAFSQTTEVVGFTARLFLHEMEHLDGQTFINDLSRLKQQKISNDIALRGKRHA